MRRIGKRCRFERSMLGCSLSRNTNMDVFYYGNEYVIFHSSGKHDMSSTFGCLYELIRADGSPAYSMFSTVIGAVLNLILDPVAIFVFHMGVRGAAIATVIGQVVSCFVTILYFRKPKSFRFSKASFLPDGRLLRQIDQILRLFGVTEASYPYAREYMEVILLGIPFYIFASGMNAAIDR